MPGLNHERDFFFLAKRRVRRGIKVLKEEGAPFDWQRRMWSITSFGQAECRVRVEDEYLNPLSLAWESDESLADFTSSVSKENVCSHLELDKARLYLFGFAADPRDPNGVENINKAWREVHL